MADLNGLLTALQTFETQAAADVAAAKAKVTSDTAQLATSTAAHLAAATVHAQAIAASAAVKVGKVAAVVEQDVAAGATAAWKWVAGVGAPTALAAAGALWAFWPKL